MRGKRARRPDSFADEPTRPYEPSAIPVFIDDEVTRPIAIEEMSVAARHSRDVPDPSDAPSPAAAQPPLHAELSIAGIGTVATLPVHRISATGVSLAVPPGVELALKDDVLVLVRIQSASVEARVAHLRAPRDGGSGGLSLRWDISDPLGQRALDVLLALPRASEKP